MQQLSEPPGMAGPDTFQTAWAGWRAVIPTAEALVDARDGSRFRVDELDHLLRCGAAWLGAEGLRPGDRMVLVARPELEALLLIHAALLCGIVPVLLFPGSPIARVDEVAAATDARLCLVGQPVVGRPDLRVLSSPELSRAIVDQPPMLDLPALDPDAEAVVLFSSGSTGPARGIRLSHRALVRGTLRALSPLQMQPGERSAVPALLHTVTGCRFVLMLPALARTSTVLLDPQASVAEQLAACRLHRVAVLHTSHGAARACAVAPERFAGLVGTELRCVVFGGGALLPQERAACADGLGLTVVHTYGATETAGTCAAAIVQPGSPPVLGMGRALVPVRIVSPEGECCAVGQLGRVLLAPDPPFLGYLDGSGPTREAGSNWVDLGDRGRVDGEGVLHLHGRHARTYTAPSGEKVQLEDLEAELRSCLGVEVVACALTVPRRGAVLCALVERDAIGPVWIGRARALVRERVPPAALPGRWLAVPELPRLPSGKLDITAACRLAEQSP